MKGISNKSTSRHQDDVVHVSIEVNNSSHPNNGSTSKTSPTKRSSRCGRRPSVHTKHYVEHNYHDHYHDPVQQELPWVEPGDSNSKKRRGHRGGVAVPFPEKLHYMLSRMEEEGTSHIVTWQPHGRCFIVHKPKEFVEKIMPRFFRQSKLTSFQRQLNLYGFSRLTAGADRGGYYHELFIQGRMDLCKRMLRTRVKGNGSKAASSPSTEPNFYAMDACRPTSARQSEDRDSLRKQVDVIPDFQAPKESEPANELSSDDDTVQRSYDSFTSENVAVPTVMTTPSPFSTVGTVSPVGCARPICSFSSHVMPSLPVVSPTERRTLISPPESPELLSSLSVPKDFPVPEEIHSGDQIFFEGLPFHYLETKDVEDSLLD